MSSLKETAPTCYRFDDVVVDCRNFRVVKGEQKRDLTPRAFDVLRYLIERPDRVVEKQELFERVWKEKFVSDNALTRTVKEIRQALGDSADAPRYIETVPKRGYRFIAPMSPQGRVASGADVSEDGRPGVVETRGAETAGGGGVAPAAGAQPLRGAAGRLKPALVVLVVAAALALVAAVLYSRRSRPAAGEAVGAPVRSIAVLPLKNLSGDAVNEYFSDGMTESLINALSKIEGLKVISRSSAFNFKGRDVDPREVGRRLGVAAVLEGSVRKDADSVRVAARLVSAEDGRVLWASDAQDHALGDIFALQDEIARGMTAALKLKLTGEGERLLARRYTDDLEAYDLYLKGRFFWNKRTDAGLRKSIEHFERAIARDPDYALAYAGLADSYAVFNLYSPAQLKDASPRAKEAAAHALALDDTLAEAHATLGLLKQQYDFDWPGAEREYRRAIELDPNYATAYQYYAEHLALLGRTEESVAQIRRARDLDPLSLIINTEMGFPYLCARRWDEALEHYRHALEMDPSFHLAIYFSARAHAQQGRLDEAVAESRRAVALSGGSTLTVGGLGYVYAAAGQSEEARKVLGELTALSRRRYVSPYTFATVHVGLGERDLALARLEEAYRERDYQLVMLRIDPRLDSLRDDPRFTDLMRRVGLAPESSSD
ncbi:MAG TPA: winged helix-turn-helix domain-containing protein [Pyrinomonadaceae bacterium]